MGLVKKIKSLFSNVPKIDPVPENKPVRGWNDVLITGRGHVEKPVVGTTKRVDPDQPTLVPWGGRQKPSNIKNPKDSVGCKKVPMSVIPANVMLEVSIGMMEGALKYGRHNYRKSGVAASIYYDACMRHLMGFWEGEDIDPDSELSHITKAISTLVVLRDGMLNDMWFDDRPPKLHNKKWLIELNERVVKLLEKYPEEERKIPYTEKHL